MECSNVVSLTKLQTLSLQPYRLAFTIQVSLAIHTSLITHAPYYVMYFVMPTVLSVFATIEVVSGRERLFRLSCTTTGGQTLKIRIEGPNIKASVESLQVKPGGDPERTGNDTS